jgi:DNA polymerase I
MKISLGDLEANGLLKEATKVHCGVFKEKGKLIKFRPSQIKEMLEYLDTVDVLIMHNGIGYDLPLLKKLYGYVFKGKVVDTLILSRLLNPKRIVPFNCLNKKAGPHSIEAWGYRVGRGKPEHNDWENFSEEMLHRCSEDVEILDLVYKALLKEAEGRSWRNAFLLSFDLFKNLQKQEEYGWKVDKDHMLRCIHQLERWISKIDRAISPHLPLVLEVEENKVKGEYAYIKKPFLKSGAYSQSVIDWCNANCISTRSDIVGAPFSRITFRKVNLNSNDETKNFLLDAGWEPKEWNTNDEGVRTSAKLSKDDPFEGVNGKMGRLVAKRVQCRQRKSIIQGLLELIRNDGAIASSVANLAETGRATHRNIVNIPGAKSFYGKQMRQTFVARAGKVLVGTDSDSCQIRMLCGRMNDPEYTDNVLNGRKEDGTDIHSVNMRAAGLQSRDDAKTFFYGFLFGAGDAKVGKIVRGSSQDGKRLKEQFLKGLPALGRLMEELQAEWRKNAKQRFNPKFNRMEYYNGWVKGLDGRPIFIASEHAILVYVLQSDEAIMMTKAYNLLWERLTSKYSYPSQFGIVCWYHDEYTIECDIDIAEDVKKISEQCIVDAAKFYNIACPHVGDGKIGKDWYAIH